MPQNQIILEESYLTLVWKEVSIYAPLKNTLCCFGERHRRFQRIVQNVSGMVCSGELIAILGSPFSANSSLLNVLACRAPNDVSITGDILVNGLNSSKMMPKISGYVEKNQRFFENITVEEHLQFHAHLRMDKRLGNYELRRRIQQLLDEFDLHPSRGMKIKDISKILKIRLSLATEMLTDPPILFCDDFNADMDCVETITLVQGLRDFANSGVAIICTLRTLPTESLDHFDQLLLLAEGRVAFNGSPRNAERFFDSLDFVCPKYFDVVDYFMYTLSIHPERELASKSQIREICLTNANSPLAKDLANRIDSETHRDREFDTLVCTIEAMQHPSCTAKTFWVFRRYLKNYCGNFRNVVSQMLQVMVTGTIIGLCMLGVDTQTQYGVQATKGFLFILVNESIFRTLWKNWNTLDLQIFLRENRLYNAKSFVIAKISLTVLVITLETFLLLIISWLIACFGKISPILFVFTWIVLFFTSLTSAAFAFAFTSIFNPHPITANSILNPLRLLLMITSGAFISIRSMPSSISWIRYLSWMYYAYESLVVLYFESVASIWCHPKQYLPCYKSGYEVLEGAGVLDVNFGTNLYFMIILCGMWYFIAYCAIVVKSVKS